MSLELVMINYPTALPLVFFILGAIYYNYLLTRNYPHFHWNLFMIGLGVLAIGFLVRLLDIFFSSGYIELIRSSAIALSALLFAFTAYVATVGDKKWRL